MPDQPPEKPTLAAERTLLSWERSAFGFLVGGALVLIREHGPLGRERLLLTLAAALLALLVLAIGYRRSRLIRTSPVLNGRIVVAAPQLEILIIGCATAAFAVAIILVLVFAG